MCNEGNGKGFMTLRECLRCTWEALTHPRYRYWDGVRHEEFLGERVDYTYPKYRQHIRTGRIDTTWETIMDDGWEALGPQRSRVFLKNLPELLENGKLRVRV